MGMNPLDQRIAELRIEMDARNRANGLAVQQMCFDAATIALHDVFGFGAERILRFQQAMYQALCDISDMLEEDVLTTSDGNGRALKEYRGEAAKEQIDRKLLSIVGKDKFLPWDERYPARIKTQKEMKHSGMPHSHRKRRR